MSEGSSMLARTWTIAATYHDPSDYGIPDAPVLSATTDESGALVLHDPDTDAAEMVAGTPVRVRR